MRKKLSFYRKYGVEEYYLYDPRKNNLQGWLRTNNILKSINNINNWVSPRLQIKFILTLETLEIYYPDGRKFLTPVELDQQRQQAELDAQRERERAERLAARLRELGKDPNLL